MLAKGWIIPSVSPYSSPVLFIQKKTGKLWMCIEFHALNANIKLNILPSSHINYFLNQLGKTKYFSIIGLATAYHQVRIAKGDMHMTKYLINKGLYEYIITLFGLYNAPKTF